MCIWCKEEEQPPDIRLIHVDLNNSLAKNVFDLMIDCANLCSM